MKQGTTTTFNFHFNIDLNLIASIDFFFHCDRDNKQKREPLLTKTYPTDGYERDGVIYMPLTQEETAVLPNKFYIEPQLNFVDKSSTKANTKAYNMEPTIYTHFIDDNESSGMEESIDISFDVDESIMLGFDYNGSINKPKVNGNELIGDKKGAELDLQDKLIAGVNITIAADGKTISAKNGGKFIIVEELPEEDIDLTAIYLLPREDEEESNIYDEYIYIENISEWEKIGSTEVNLDNYYTKDEVNSLLDDKQDITSATGHISINNNVITTEANKVYTAVMKNGSISTDLADYPNLDRNDIAIYFDAGKFRLWLINPYAPSSVAGWEEVDYNTRKVYEKTTDPITAIYIYEHYQIGDIWIKNHTDAWLLVNITVTSPPSATATWISLNGVDLSNYYTKGESDNKYQNKITSQNKLDADLVDDTSSDNKFVTLTDIIAWNNKQEPISQNNKLNADYVDDTNSSNKFVTVSEKQGWNAKADNTTITTDTSATTVSLTLADNHEYRYTQELTSLTLTMPSGDFISSIVFASGSTPTSMTYDSSIKWSGDDITNGQFVPSADKDYDICLYYNGLNVNGIVRGV